MAINESFREENARLQRAYAASRRARLLGRGIEDKPDEVSAQTDTNHSAIMQASSERPLKDLREGK
jgi:hypothetical protein